MIERQRWVEHQFNLDIHPGWAHNILSRAEDAHIRIRYHCKNLSDDDLSRRVHGQWSIKEHIGHLIDLEQLHHHRLRQFEAFKKELTAADMSNAKTYAADYNKEHIEVLIDRFTTVRNDFIQDFMLLNNEVHQHEAVHPRLQVIMKPVDLLFFISEHDDHHIRTMIEIKQSLNT